MNCRPTETVSDIDAAVQRILASPVPELPLEIAEVAMYRSAARRIVEADILKDDKLKRVMVLRDDLRGTVLPEWCQRAVAEEAQVLWRRKPIPSYPPLSRDRAQSALHRAGFGTCPTCKQRIASEEELNRHNRRRRADEVEAAVRRNAVHHSAVRSDAE